MLLLVLLLHFGAADFVSPPHGHRGLVFGAVWPQRLGCSVFSYIRSIYITTGIYIYSEGYMSIMYFIWLSQKSCVVALSYPIYIYLFPWFKGSCYAVLYTLCLDG